MPEIHTSSRLEANFARIITEVDIGSSLRNVFRRKQKQRLPCPNTLEELRKLVDTDDSNPVCRCDQCDPRLYESYCNCILRLHHHPILKFKGAANKFGYQCYEPLTMASRFRSEAMTLTRTAVRYFDRPVDTLNTTQLTALTNIQTWIQHYMSLIFPNTPAGSPASLDEVFPIPSIRDLWTQINVLFFGSDMFYRKSKFRWLTEFHIQYPDVMGAAWRDYYYNITIEPTLDSFDMLGTLLHEICHSFFQQYSCQSCRSRAGNLCSDGHGRAWQILSSAMERKFTELTGLPIDLGRFEAIRHHWKNRAQLSTLHDFGDWELERQTLMRSYECDLTAAVASHVRRGAEVEDFPLKVYGEYWWVDSVQATDFMREAGLGRDMDIQAQGKLLEGEDSAS